MTNARSLLWGLAAGSAVAVLAYSFSRRAQPTRSSSSARASLDARDQTPDRGVTVFPQRALRGVQQRAAAGVAREEPPAPTVQCMPRLPAPIGADDVEAPGPDEIGSDWLSRATQSGRSLSEADLELDLENIAELVDEPDVGEQGFDDYEV